MEGYNTRSKNNNNNRSPASNDSKTDQAYVETRTKKYYTHTASPYKRPKSEEIGIHSTETNMTSLLNNNNKTKLAQTGSNSHVTKLVNNNNNQFTINNNNSSNITIHGNNNMQIDQNTTEQQLSA